MLKRHHVTRSTFFVLRWYIVSLLIVSIVGSYVGIGGKKTPITSFPTTTYETVSFTSQARDQVQLGGWYFPASSKQVSVIAHGWGGNRSTFLGLAEYLQAKDINVLTFDLRGGTGKNSYGEYESQDIASAIDWLKTNKNISPESITLIGNSMGGAASIDYAAEHPVGKLVLISSIIDLKETKLAFARDLHLIIPSLYANGITLFERVFYGVWPTNPIDVFDKIKNPVLVFHGSKDAKTPIKNIYQLQEKTKTTNQKVEYVIYNNATHIFLLDNPETLTPTYEKIVAFISS